MPSFLFDAWSLIAIACVAIVSFILGLIVDAIMRDDGFGAIGNAVIIGAGFFTGIFLGLQYGFPRTDLVMTAASGLGGSGVSIAVLSGLKAGLNRLV